MIDLAWLVTRALCFALTLQAAGMALYAVRLSRYAPQAAARITADARRAAIAAVVVVVAEVVMEPAYLAGELSGVVDADVARFALQASGSELALRLAGVALLALGGRRGSAAPASVRLAGGALAVLSFAVSGHVPHSERRALLLPLLLFHVSVAAGWFGALWPLYRVTRLAGTRELAQVLREFSRLAVWLVPLTAAAGVAMAAGLLTGFAALAQPYGLLLLAKASVFALALALAALNRLRLVPAIARGEHASVGTLRATLIGEYLLLGAALAVTAIMSGLYSPS